MEWFLVHPKLIQIGQISFPQHLAFEQPFKINIIVSPAKAIRYPTKDIASKKHSQHVDGVIYCPVKIHTCSKDNLFDFRPEASLLTNKPIVFYKGAFHHRSIIDEILFGALLSTQLSWKEKTFTFFPSKFFLKLLPPTFPVRALAIGENKLRTALSSF